jgi:uncharacterized protein YbjT (DUF2867 family)
MRVAVIGANGLIGSHVVAGLLRDGVELVGVGRDIAMAARRQPGIAWVRLDLATATAAQWADVLRGASAIVNCAGALQDGPADDLEAAHVEGLRRLLAGAAQAGVRRVVQVSAAGVEASPGAFGRTKRAAEAVLRDAPLDWVVLRPGLVLAPVAFGGSALLRGLAACPFVIPLVNGAARLQVVGTDDIVRAVAAALRPEVPSGTVADLVAAEEVTLAHLLRRLRGWLGLRPAPTIDLPSALAGLAARVADGLAWLGWRSPLRSTTLAQLAAGVRGDATQAERLLGLRTRGLDEWLAAHPAGVQEAWFARLYLLKPVVLAGLALFWVVSGLVGALRLAEGASVLEQAGFGPALARGAVLMGSAVDVALGLLLLHRRSARAALLGMMLVTAAYLLGASLWRPDLWLDPLGPLVKTLPAALLAATALATLEER